MNTLRSIIFRRLTALLCLAIVFGPFLASTQAATTRLGRISGKLAFKQPALLYRQNARYEFNTAATGKWNSHVAVVFATAGGNGYNVDLYYNGYHIGSTSAYAFGPLYYRGFHAQLVPGIETAYLPMEGLPAGKYVAIVSRSGLLGTSSDYRMSFRFPAR